MGSQQHSLHLNHVPNCSPPRRPRCLCALRSLPRAALLPHRRHQALHSRARVGLVDDSTGLGTIGITEYAQKALGDVVYVELPAEGTEVATGEEMGAVESVKAASDIFAPVSGQI